MSESRQQALIKAPIEKVWELVGDPSRHPEWWPGVLEVRGSQFDTGDVYVQVTRAMGRSRVTSLQIDRVEDLRELRVHCQATGLYSRWLLTPARNDTFVEAELGMEPVDMGTRVFDATAGRRYFRRWLEASIDGLSRCASP